MAGQMVLPRVHVMVLCDEIEPSPAEEGVFDLRGVRTRITAAAFPYEHPQLCVYLQMTGHEGRATGCVVVINAESDEEVFATQESSIGFHGPLAFVPIPWRLFDCRFPDAGLYYVQVFFDGKLLGERALFVTQSEATAGNGQQIG
jgi:hypothetical protein